MNTKSTTQIGFYDEDKQIVKKNLIFDVRLLQLTDIVVFFVLGLFFLVDFVYQIFKADNVFVLLTFLLIGIHSFTKIVVSKVAISLKRIFHIFIFIFFYYAPLHQYVDKAFFWRSTAISDGEFLFCNVLIIVSLFVIDLFFTLVKPAKNNVNRHTTRNNAAIYSAIISIIVFVYFFFAFDHLIEFSYDTIGTSINKVLRFIPVALLLVFIIKNTYFKRTINILCLSITGFVVVYLYFPLSGEIARYLLFGTYIVLLYPFFKKSKSYSLLPTIIFIGFLLVFPAFNYFKDNNGFSFDMFTSHRFSTSHVDYDAYQMFVQSIRYVNLNGIMYGQNILTTVLFFVPRTIWPGKQLHSGELVPKFLGLSYDNLSMPFIAEFYLAFGIIGILLGSILIAFLLKKLDTIRNNSIGIGITYVIGGMLLYLLRGALLPTVSYAMSCIIGYFIAVICICKRTTIISKINEVTT